MASLDKKLGSILVKENRVKVEDMGRLLKKASTEKRPMSEVLVRENVISAADLLGVIAIHANLPPIDLEKVQINDELRDKIPEDVCQTCRVVPVEKIGDYLTIAVANPFDILKLDDIRIITGCELRPVVALEDKIEAALQSLFKSTSEAMSEILEDFDDADIDTIDHREEGDDLDLGNLDGASPVVKIVNKIILDAVNNKVSDIHIEPYEKRVVVRYRKDGSLMDVMNPPKKLQNSIVSRIKIMSKLDIAEKRKPQDGKIQMKLGNKKIDFRVSTLPVVFGEKVVLRILDSSNLTLDLDTLGFEQKCMDDFKWGISKPYGMILVTGPTGSGKSTTLYSGIHAIHKPDINIVTVEDPVEYTLEGVNQVPVNPIQGLTFASALRSILRQDPDVILLGEIRDKETIEIAVKAALTGHLVFSTLHTNDAPSTVTRMVDMGLDPFMVASSVNVICAQRLAKKLCDSCKQPVEVPEKRFLELGAKQEDLKELKDGVYKAVGCNRCAHGYKGRFALLETLQFTEQIKRKIIEEASALDIKAAAMEEGMVTLRRAGLLNAIRGKTSLEEILRVTMADG
ncbi:MAG: type IV-A pilus assembly ATPase PilB [Planctomycetota bacterium]